MNLTKSQIAFLTHVRDNNGLEPEIPEGSKPVVAINQEKTKAKLLQLGYLTPAKRGRVIISNSGISTLQQIEFSSKKDQNNG